MPQTPPPKFRFPNVRDYFAEKQYHARFEQALFQKSHFNEDEATFPLTDSDMRRHFSSVRDRNAETANTRAANAELSRAQQILKDPTHQEKEPFEFYSPLFTGYPPNRLPSPGILPVPVQFHTGRTVEPTDRVPETGFPIHPAIVTIITNDFPQFSSVLTQFCRPLGTTNAVFTDFNRPQVVSDPIEPSRLERVLNLVIKKLDAKPFLPLHYVDTQYADLPLTTGTGYHNRHSYKIKAHAKFSHPEEYAMKSTSKGYFYNAFHEYARTMIHRIKECGYPFIFEWSASPTSDELTSFSTKMNHFLNSYPTLLFTRTHISPRDGKLKQRPVYACDELMLHLEVMLTFPLLVHARDPACCIMYGLETMRGSNHHLDFLAKDYQSYFTVDWSFFDQTLPRVVTDLFFTHFLPRLIVINQGYAPTRDYATYPDLTIDKMYTRVSNMLHFLHLWYNNMTFVTQDGYGYRRTHAGVSSGHLNTQYLDSFGNLFILIDALCSFGCSDPEIEDILFFIMGDDNSGFTHWTIERLDVFITFLETYASHRYNMTLSKTKSIITTLRNKIQTLGYECNFGSPLRPIERLVAQLCMPERDARDKYMSSRAIGMAYAACGQDETFHALCEQVYLAFRHLAPLVLPETDFLKVLKALPSQISHAIQELPNISFDVFPDIETVRQLVSTYHGPLSPEPKWNQAHFLHSPTWTAPDPTTLHEYRIVHGLTAHSAPILDPTQ
jgi:hypothetical protein